MAKVSRQSSWRHWSVVFVAWWCHMQHLQVMHMNSQTTWIENLQLLNICSAEVLLHSTRPSIKTPVLHLCSTSAGLFQSLLSASIFQNPHKSAGKCLFFGSVFSPLHLHLLYISKYTIILPSPYQLHKLVHFTYLGSHAPHDDQNVKTSSILVLLLYILDLSSFTIVMTTFHSKC